MKKLLLLSTAIWLGLAAPTISQVNTVPQVGVDIATVWRNTYSSATLNLPPAAAATDIACIAGSASKTIFIDRITVTGVAGTLITVPVSIVRRAAVDTGGTAATTTANWGNNTTRNDTLNPAVAATLISYSANPTINDTSPTYFGTSHMTLATAAASTVTVPVSFTWSGREYSERPTLRGAAQQLCINLNGSTISSGLINATIQWTEE